MSCDVPFLRIVIRRLHLQPQSNFKSTVAIIYYLAETKTTPAQIPKGIDRMSRYISVVCSGIYHPHEAHRSYLNFSYAELASLKGINFSYGGSHHIPYSCPEDRCVEIRWLPGLCASCSSNALRYGRQRGWKFQGYLGYYT